MAREEPSADRLFAEVLRAGESLPRVRELLGCGEPDESLLLAVLRRPVPVRFLEHLGTVAPWSDRPRILGGVALNPKTPRSLALRLLSALFWRDLADVAASPRLQTAVRVRAEGILKEKLPEMRLGDRVALARLATPAIVALLLEDLEARVVRASLQNPRLREEDLLSVLRRPTAPRLLIEETGASSRWSEAYAVRLALVLQARTPLALALAQISSLVRRDLLRVARAPGLSPLVQAAALRVAAGAK